MTRLFIHPDWVGLLDFETRLPGAVERAIARARGARQQGRELAAEAAAGATPLLGAPSLTAALDCFYV